MPKRARGDDAPASERRVVAATARRASTPGASGSGGNTTVQWGYLPQEVLEMIFVRLTGPVSAVSSICYRWRVASVTFPRPVLYCPESSKLLVPTSVIPRGLTVSKTVASEGCSSFRYVSLAAQGAPLPRLIGASSPFPIFWDVSRTRIVSPQFAVFPGVNVSEEALLTVDLPAGVSLADICYGIVGRNLSSHLRNEQSNSCFLLTKTSILGVLLKGSRRLRGWTQVKLHNERSFLIAVSLGRVTYFLDQHHQLLSCTVDTIGNIHSDEVVANRNELLDCHIKTLKTWILTLEGEAPDESVLLSLRYEHTMPRSYRFVLYQLNMGHKVKSWKVCRELKDCCIFINWGTVAEAFCYRHPEKIGLKSYHVYDSRQGYSLRKVYKYSVMPRTGSLAWPFSIWVQQHGLFPCPFHDTPGLSQHLVTMESMQLKMIQHGTDDDQVEKD